MAGKALLNHEHSLGWKPFCVLLAADPTDGEDFPVARQPFAYLSVRHEPNPLQQVQQGMNPKF